MHGAHVHASQHPWVGTVGDIAMSVLLHRYVYASFHIVIKKKNLLVFADLGICETDLIPYCIY